MIILEFLAVILVLAFASIFAVYYYKLSQLKMHDNEIPVADVTFVSTNFLPK